MPETYKIQFRTSKDQKDLLKKAAFTCGFRSLSEFVRVSAYEKIKREFPDFFRDNLTLD